MSNMNYCKYRNTLNVLRDCQYTINDIVDNNEDEERARQKLLDLCIEIAEEFLENNTDEGGNK